uniref:Uncharacterized protein n=1 Tax=virus sp. ctBS918 TaxID=2825807 RepID=A0A8S5RP15_9VIRU|nr:MAG TPA: hypothetical protein [virus sp. ctBS918]
MYYSLLLDGLFEIPCFVYPREILFLLTLRKDRPYQGTISCATHTVW